MTPETNNPVTPTATAVAALVKTLRGYDAKEERIRKGLHLATGKTPKVVRHSESGKWTLVPRKDCDGQNDGYELVFTPSLAPGYEGMTLQECHWLYYFTNGRKGSPHPALNLRDWLAANTFQSTGKGAFKTANVVLPRGVADICMKCGYQDCKCRKANPPHNPATCDCPYHVALRKNPMVTRRIGMECEVAPGYTPDAGPVPQPPPRLFAKQEAY